MAEFIYALLVVASVVLMTRFLFGSKECNHRWVRYTIQKSFNSPRQKCIICKLCGKSYIKEMGLEIIEESWLVSRHIDVDWLWKNADDPYEGSVEQLMRKHGMHYPIDTEVNPGENLDQMRCHYENTRRN